MSVPKSEYISNAWREGTFDNKVVFCTGGNGTICSAMVRALVYLGANACIVGRNGPKTEEMAKSIATARKGTKVLGYGGVDVRSMESLTAAVDKCVAELGQIDYVIAGAAGNFLAPITGLSSNAFKTVMEIDVLGSYNALKATLPHLEKSAKANPNDGKNASTGGRIIFISATLHYAGRTFQTHAMAAKAAVDAISSGAAIELGPRGITSNIIAPGPIGGTEGMERLSRADTQSRAAALRSIPSGRWGTVKEIADAGVYLFADTGNYVNGATIVVDGGEWRTMAQYSSDPKVRYPDDVLNFQMPEGAKSGRKEKAKL